MDDDGSGGSGKEPSSDELRRILSERLAAVAQERRETSNSPPPTDNVAPNSVEPDNGTSTSSSSSGVNDSQPQTQSVAEAQPSDNQSDMSAVGLLRALQVARHAGAGNTAPVAPPQNLANVEAAASSLLASLLQFIVASSTASAAPPPPPPPQQAPSSPQQPSTPLDAVLHLALQRLILQQQQAIATAPTNADPLLNLLVEQLGRSQDRSGGGSLASSLLTAQQQQGQSLAPAPPPPPPLGGAAGLAALAPLLSNPNLASLGSLLSQTPGSAFMSRGAPTSSTAQPQANLPSTRRSLEGPEPFPQKLYRLLEETDQANQQHIVGWMPDGISFRIHKPREFMKMIAPNYFRHTKIASFMRQLQMYNFERVCRGNVVDVHIHPSFQRGSPHLLPNVRRITSSRQRQDLPTSSPKPPPSSSSRAKKP